tara:strand:- start:444 stop:590 length:147 start_codon:yes stop_codon:yes gene_type:complete
MRKKKITSRDIEELYSMASLYNYWDKTSMRMALYDIQKKLRGMMDEKE